MSRVQLLYDLVQDLRTVADDVQAIADALMQTDDAPPLPEQKAIPQTTAAPAADKADAEPDAPPLPEQKAIPQTTAAPAADKADAEPDAPITKEQVRDVLKQLSRSGYRDAVQNLILSYGVGTFSELPESEYADILKQAEAIANAA